MKVVALQNAIAEAERFLRVAKKVKIVRGKYDDDDGEPYLHIMDYKKESAACRRASMDLTRALSAMRKPQGG